MNSYLVYSAFFFGLRPKRGLIKRGDQSVVTLGKRGENSDLLFSEEILQSRGITTAWVDRGGQATYHGPGQLVGYPIINLRHHQRKIKRFVHNNLETIPRLYPQVRPQADYRQSLEVLRQAKQLNPRVYTKSGLMVGLGESESEIHQVMDDLRSVNCDFLTIGQYLPPSKSHFPVAEYIHPDNFKSYQRSGYKKGFAFVASAPFVRSSYKAEEMIAAMNESAEGPLTHELEKLDTETEQRCAEEGIEAQTEVWPEY